VLRNCASSTPYTRRTFCFSRSCRTVADDLLCPFLAVLPGDEIALLDGALFAVAALPFEITVSCPRAGIAGKPGRCILPSCSPYLSCGTGGLAAGVSFRCGLRPWQAFFPLARSYTLRFFGGRQPLCGMGVTSLIDRTSIARRDSARTADSRPDPGPLTRTSTVRNPLSPACWRPSEPPAARRTASPSATRGSPANRRSTRRWCSPPGPQSSRWCC